KPFRRNVRFKVFSVARIAFRLPVIRDFSISIPAAVPYPVIPDQLIGNFTTKGSLKHKRKLKSFIREGVSQAADKVGLVIAERGAVVFCDLPIVIHIPYNRIAGSG